MAHAKSFSLLQTPKALKRGYRKATQKNAIQRVKQSQRKRKPNKAFAGPSIRPDTRGLKPVTPGKSRPTTQDYNIQKGYPARAAKA